MEITQVYQNLQQQIKELRKQATEAAGKIIQEGLRELFDNYPKLESIGWRQYTPYWNDGEECVFEAYTDEPDINGVDGGYIGYDGDTGFSYEDNKEISRRVSKTLKQISEDEFQALFGDHCRVTLYRDGRAEAEEYEHD